VAADLDLLRQRWWHACLHCDPNLARRRLPLLELLIDHVENVFGQDVVDGNVLDAAKLLRRRVALRDQVLCVFEVRFFFVLKSISS
jgi:hypothetical protein